MSKSFLFIPDISGFTNFVQHTEIEHSQHIISELLELLIENNELDLQLAEVEGDALFFYIHNAVPSLEAVLAQVKRMYLAFHNHLRLYTSHRICHCGACSTADKLKLKFVIHSGEFGFIEVQKNRKPFGPPVIAVHRLLKNDIESPEYALISTETLEDGAAIDRQLWTERRAQYDFGEISYYFRQLTDFKEQLDEFSLETNEELAQKIFQLDEVIDCPLDQLFEYLANFKYRANWNAGLKELRYDEKELNRVGTKHVCVLDSGTVEFETVKHDFGKPFKVYGERTKDIPGFSKMDSYFLLKPKGNQTELSVRVYGQTKGLIGSLLKPLIRRKLGKGINQSMQNLKVFAERKEA